MKRIEDRTRVILRPDSISTADPDFAAMPALPTEVNCNRFSVPAVGIFIPVRTNVGRGPSYEVNIAGESCP